MIEATSLLAQFVSNLRFKDLPESVVAQAKNCLLNFTACAVAGSNEAIVTKTITALSQYMAPGNVSIIGKQHGADPISASFLNSLSSAVLAFDETHARALIHPVGPVASAILAMAEERQLNGRDFLCALVAGVEVACRASMAISVVPANGPVGWSQTGICGGLGASAALSRLLRLDANSTSDAIALGANSSAGLRAMNGTAAVAMAAANASANGYRAALLAAGGVTASRTVFEHPYGFVKLFSETGFLPHLTDGLGESYAICETNFKPYPCGVVAHASIDAARAIRSTSSFSHADIEVVLVRLHSSCLSLGDRPIVSNENEASVSIQYWVATALLRNNLGPSCLSVDWLNDPARQQLQERVRLFVDDTFSRSSAEVVVKLCSGKELSMSIANGLGSERKPMKADDIEAKFIDTAATQFNDSQISEIIAACRQIEKLEDVGHFARMLRAAPQRRS